MGRQILQATRVDAAAAASSLSYKKINADTVLEKVGSYLVDISANTAVTLPAAPKEGDSVVILDSRTSEAAVATAFATISVADALNQTVFDGVETSIDLDTAPIKLELVWDGTSNWNASFS